MFESGLNRIDAGMAQIQRRESGERPGGGARPSVDVPSPLPTGARERKRLALVRGLLDYFPNACTAVAEVSFVGNQQHNPGEEMHWARSKSTDEADCIVRHLLERGTFDTDGLRHTAKAAWRALALLQKEIEEQQGLPISRGSRP